MLLQGRLGINRPDARRGLEFKLNEENGSLIPGMSGILIGIPD